MGVSCQAEMCQLLAVFKWWGGGGGDKNKSTAKGFRTEKKMQMLVKNFTRGWKQILYPGDNSYKRKMYTATSCSQ